VTTVLGSGSDPFQPSVIPFNVGAITCGYLAGVALVRPWRSRRTKDMVRSGSDNAYGIYLSQMLFITPLTWPQLCLLTVAIVFGGCIALTSVLAAGLPAGTEVRVARLAAGRYVPCPALEVGRVQIRGRGVITEYAANGPAGAIDPEGWLDTGDLGHLDQDGYLFLAGRSDDVINRGGEKIYPREIEDVLLAQPGVRFAAVVGVHDEVLGERPVAYIVPAETSARRSTSSRATT